jgi:hypothetical protein
MTQNERLQLIGWVLFVLCAVLYILSSMESRSITGLLGSVVFLIACIFFIIPFIRKDDEP